MKDKVEEARKAGYSDQEISEFLSKKDPRISKAIESGYEPQEVVQFLSKQKKSKNFGHEGKIIGGKLGRAIEAVQQMPSLLGTELPTAILKSAEGVAAINDPISAAFELHGREKPSASKMAASYLRQNLPEELKQGAEDVADIESFLLPLPALGKAKLPKGAKIPKGPSAKDIASHAMIVERSGLSPKPKIKETYASGLAKPAAEESSFSRFATISKERQKAAIEKLDKEATGLIKNSVSEKLPLSKKMEEGFDFDSYHSREFGKLKHLAEKANPTIDISPLSEFFLHARKKYHGIPSLHPDAKKVMNEISAFNKKIPSGLKNLLRIRRSNGQKLNSIYESRLMSGKQAEYADFLTDMNKKIDESIFKTLPEDSAWVKDYKRLNQEFKEFKNTQDTLSFLEPLMREKISSNALTRLAEDSKKQKYLRLKMGNDEANQVIQVAKDLKRGREAIKKIPVKKIESLDALSPFEWLKNPIKQGLNLSRRAYGHILSNAAEREAFDIFLKEVTSEAEKIK